jgi:hypothetical protein
MSETANSTAETEPCFMCDFNRESPYDRLDHTACKIDMLGSMVCSFANDKLSIVNADTMDGLAFTLRDLANEIRLISDHIHQTGKY